jgi:hypothetical protein
METSMSLPKFAYSARFAAAWLVLAVLTATLGLQILSQLREFGTGGSLTAELCIQAATK